MLQYWVELLGRVNTSFKFYFVSLRATEFCINKPN